MWCRLRGRKSPSDSTECSLHPVHKRRSSKTLFHLLLRVLMGTMSALWRMARRVRKRFVLCTPICFCKEHPFLRSANQADVLTSSFHSITAPIHSSVCSFMRAFVRPFVRSFLPPFSSSLPSCLHSHSFILSFIHWFVRLFVHSFSRSFVHSFLRPCVHLFIFHSYICPFVCSSICSFPLDENLIDRSPTPLPSPPPAFFRDDFPVTVHLDRERDSMEQTFLPK